MKFVTNFLKCVWTMNWKLFIYWGGICVIDYAGEACKKLWVQELIYIIQYTNKAEEVFSSVGTGL